MDKKDKDRLRSCMIEKIHGLKEEIKAYRMRTQPVPPDNAIGRLTRMEAINDKSIYEAALGKATLTLSKLERMLPAIDEADFGLCRECEEPIPFGRLMIMPEADLCVQCAGALEG